MPPELVIAARHLQISLCRDTTLAWRQLLWHNQVTHNDWIRDHNSRPLQSAPFDTFADAFQSNTTTTYWSFIPRHTATIQDKAHLPWFFMLSAGLGLQATAPLLNPQSRVWFPTPPPRTNLRQQGSYVKRLSTTIGTHLHPPSPIDHKYADRRAALCADLNLPYRPDAWTRPWHASYLPGSLQWFQYRWHFQAFRFKHSSINPLCPYCGNPDKSSHTFWTCPRAHALWTTLLQIWYGDVAAKPSDYIANLTSAEQPRAARWMLQAPQWKTHGTAYDNLCHQGWTLLRSLGFRILWTERCKAIHADPLAPPALPSHLPTSTPPSSNNAAGHPLAPPSHTTCLFPHAASSFLMERLGWKHAVGDPVPSLCHTMHHCSVSTTPTSLPLLRPTTSPIICLIRALTLAVSMRLTHVEVCGDSNLLMNHLRGLNRVRHSGLRDSYVQARTLASTLHCVFAHRPRKFNQAADFLSKQAPDDCCDYGTHAQRRPLSPSDTATFYDFLDLDLLHNPG
ncbi:hypothetical protein H257_10697 [Aphanomyces astaci]|uniref:RNase H type-1 domain-containing protein n=1 Tax=Aphanomyces astaci TaxID=112090 RepID=W4G784_APHAT|nr:hypothetical protein H257_10697 [Aphanomyces astaci]ETV75131.1 hypothetical protein H257_10697 [Aphanomyces astaci]|eukprot:XP_009835635.1 hypothetical protein H257_10697 [Aphanomyces astaci]